jgi:hypothetical protein
VLTIWVCNFWQKDFGTKAAQKMLVKLTPVWLDSPPDALSNLSCLAQYLEHEQVKLSYCIHDQNVTEQGSKSYQG